MTNSPGICAERVDRALGECSPESRRTGGGSWRLPFQPDPTSEMDIRLRDQWLLVRAPLGNGTPPPDTWNHLCVNADAPGRCKIVMDPRDGALYVQQDVPAIAGADMTAQCRQALTDIQQAALRLCKAENQKPAHRPDFVSVAEQVSAETDAPLPMVKEACRAGGWDCREREGGRLAIRLDVPGRVYKALVDTRSDHDVRVTAEMARYATLARIQREAVATFLLQANGWIRYARAAARVICEGEGADREVASAPVSGDPVATAFCEVRLTELPSEQEINHALSALSVACRFCACELDALRDDQTARAFLNVRGAHSQRSPGRVEEGMYSSTNT